MGSTKKIAKQIGRREREAQQALKKRTLRKRILFIGGGVLLLVAVFLAVFFPLRAAGTFLRWKTVASTDHYTVDGAMYSYYFYSSFYDELSGSTAEVYKNNGITEKSDLRAMTYGDGKSWFAFFEGVSASRLQTILQYAEAAADEGVTLSAAGEAELEKTIADLRSEAAGKGISFDRYLADRFGIGVKEKDIRGFLSIYLLAGEMAEFVKEDVPVSAEELNALRKEPEYLVASLFYYVCKADVTASMSAEAQAAAKEEARENARRLSELSDPQSFVNEVRRQEEHLAEHRGEEFTDEYFEEVRADFSYINIPYDTAILIDEKIESRTARETVIFAEEGTGSYGVVLVIEPPHVDDTPTYNYHMVTFDAANAAASMMASLTGGAAPTENLATGHTTVEGDSFPNMAIAGGGREKRFIENGAASAAGDDDLAAWLQEGREAGDLLLLAGESDGEGSFSGSATLVYFCGDGLTPFERVARNRILSQKYAEIDKEIAEKYASVTVKKDSGDAVAYRR